MNNNVVQISPYPGLRPFTEEESIFFKGRDTHIRQIIQQLEERKIVVITGASGDGKSSIVYAGVIPNARAGFFRAPNTNWLIADFRPERSPLSNLANALSETLLMDVEKIEHELSYGFSSLVELYKKSEFSGKNSDSSKNANLMILADQFEEFFTNSENYSHGKASEEAYLTVNLLLETAKIALDENLPIYVIFTMRSDFISQSVAFKGLPETIGFSQFFVPRLKRHELQRVIEDPAKLAGGKIAPRLTQVLINELPEGFDQLPLLQHALNRLWKDADNGNQTLDFIHLARIGGFDSELLSSENKAIFDDFLFSLDDKTKHFFDNPGFSNILNLHANLLFSNTLNYIHSLNWIQPKPEASTVELVLQTAFKSLTKIDQGRAVRNRAELVEIKRIINRKDVSYELVCAVINSYRMPDSTFVRPFIVENNIESELLAANTVLDITHEALIRNWEALYNWGIEEQGYLNDYEDLKIQLNRWLQNDRDKAYLLSRGALAHFQEWFDKSRPNPFWIAKNENWALEYEAKLQQAELVFNQINDFLNASDQQLLIIEAAKKRRRRIGFIAAGIFIVVLSGFSVWALSERNFAVKQQQIANREKENAVKSQQMAEVQKAKALQNEERAIEAKKISDSARLVAIEAQAFAEKQTQIAEKQKQIAEKQTTRAKKETENAKLQKKIADSERLTAEKQRQLAIAASDSAKQLSYLALAQSLAYKAKSNFEDKQLNLLTAYQAYLYNKNYGGYAYDPTIFEGLRYVAQLMGLTSDIPLEKNTKIAAIRMLNNQKMLYLTKNGKFVQLDFKTQQKKEIADFANKNVDINAAFIPDSNHIILSFNNYQNQMVQVSDRKMFQIDYHENYLRAAIYIPELDAIITGGRDNKTVLAKIEKDEINVLEKFEMNAHIRAMDYAQNINQAWIGLQNGELYIYEPQKSKPLKISSFNEARVNTIQILDKKNMAAIGLSNGHLIFMDLKTHKTIHDLFVSYAEIKLLSLNPAQSQLAIALADNTIRLFQTDYLNEKPIEISGKYKRIEALSIRYGKQMQALDANNELKVYYISPDEYAKLLESEIQRNFSTTEWEQIIGKEVPYEKTK